MYPESIDALNAYKSSTNVCRQTTLLSSIDISNAYKKAPPNRRGFFLCPLLAEKILMG